MHRCVTTGNSSIGDHLPPVAHILAVERCASGWWLRADIMTSCITAPTRRHDSCSVACCFVNPAALLRARRPPSSAAATNTTLVLARRRTSSLPHFLTFRNTSLGFRPFCFDAHAQNFRTVSCSSSFSTVL